MFGIESPTFDVFVFALFTAVATGLGAIPFLFFRNVTKEWLGIGNAIAAGLMLTASFGLIFEGNAYSEARTLIGGALGVVFIFLSRKFLENRNHLEIGDLEGASALKALLFVAIMTVHSFAEGIGVGVAFGEGEQFGLVISLAIAVHNIPEGLAVGLVLIPKGMKVWKVILLAIVTSLPQPLMAVPAFWFVETFRPILPIGLGFAAGAMVWVVFSELVPESLQETTPRKAAVAATVSVLLMAAFQTLIGQ
ncbi:MAG: ZIP family metal transporter [Sumerlaeia bacterium]